jgi:ATP-dependent protease ClpP protease subunit
MNASIFPLILLSVYLPFVHLLNPIFLNSSNVIVIRDAIDDDTATQFIYELNKKSSKQGVYVYLDTPGGSVESGSKIMMEVQKYNLSCIADRAYSMGFVILQSCANRYIRPYGRIMQHQISYAIKNEKGKIDSYANFIDQIETELVEMQAGRIGMDPDAFRLKTMNDWWMIGKYALDNNCVDEIVDVYCNDVLTNQNETDAFGPITVVQSKCPLVPGYIDSYLGKKK